MTWGIRGNRVTKDIDPTHVWFIWSGKREILNTGLIS